MVCHHFRYPPHGRRAIAIETGVQWDRIRAPPVDTSPHDLHISDCLNDLRPGDHIEIQWRRNKEFPYGLFLLLPLSNLKIYLYSFICQSLWLLEKLSLFCLIKVTVSRKRFCTNTWTQCPENDFPCHIFQDFVEPKQKIVLQLAHNLYDRRPIQS